LFEPAQAPYLPVTQEWHVLPEDGWYLPVGQSLHEVDSATAKRPLAHGVQEAALYTVLYVAAVHGVHAPLLLRNLPGMQAGVGCCVGV
jgi:hypothetical protein